jgi:phosphohistidine phosphatase
MRVILVHHGDAVGPEVDTQRPLSAVGMRQAESLARQAAEAKYFPAAIWHSGKLRARQTAEPFLKLNPFAEFKMVRGLLPEDWPDAMAETLRHENRDLVLAGHMPNIAALALLLDERVGHLHLHSACGFERGGIDQRWVFQWRALPESM